MRAKSAKIRKMPAITTPPLDKYVLLRAGLSTIKGAQRMRLCTGISWSHDRRPYASLALRPQISARRKSNTAVMSMFMRIMYITNFIISAPYRLLYNSAKPVVSMVKVYTAPSPPIPIFTGLKETRKSIKSSKYPPLSARN
jgi:hypothetical protein